jgi:hypothetical protein
VTTTMTTAVAYGAGCSVVTTPHEQEIALQTNTFAFATLRGDERSIPAANHAARRAWRSRKGLAAAGMALAVTLLPDLHACADSAQLLWEVKGLENPESVLFDAARQRLYVSNVNGNPTDADGNGYLSLLSMEGELLTPRWVDGFNAPKGMALVDKQLYVSDIDRLIVVDVETARITATYQVPQARFLNDVTADADGNVYVSDMFDNAIYRLSGSALALWLRDAALDSPNGLLAETDRLLVVSWGDTGTDQRAPIPGAPRAVHWGDRSVSILSDKRIGHLDGVELAVAQPAESSTTSEDGHATSSAVQTTAEQAEAGDSAAPVDDRKYLITDWVNGRLLLWDEGADEAETLLDLPQGSADIGVIPAAGIVLVPLMADGIVQAYRLVGDD